MFIGVPPLLHILHMYLLYTASGHGCVIPQSFTKSRLYNPGFAKIRPDFQRFHIQTLPSVWARYRSAALDLTTAVLLLHTYTTKQHLQQIQSDLLLLLAPVLKPRGSANPQNYQPIPAGGGDSIITPPRERPALQTLKGDALWNSNWPWSVFCSKMFSLVEKMTVVSLWLCAGIVPRHNYHNNPNESLTLYICIFFCNFPLVILFSYHD